MSLLENDLYAARKHTHQTTILYEDGEWYILILVVNSYAHAVQSTKKWKYL